MSRRIVFVSAFAGAIVCALVAPASAHVSISPPSAPEGSTAKLSFIVPNEEATATVTKVAIAFPTPPAAPIAQVAVGQKPGWRSTVVTKHLAEPIETDDGSISDVVSQITWTVTAPANAVKPGEFGEFTVNADGLPEDESEVVFRAVQTYSDGTIVRWIDPVTPDGPEAEFPTPILELTKPDDATASTDVTTPTSTASPTTIVSTTTKDNSARALAIIGIALGAVALVFATGALVRRRRSRAASPGV